MGFEIGHYQRTFAWHHVYHGVVDIGFITEGIGVQRDAVLAIGGGIRHHRIASPVSFHPGAVFNINARRARRFDQHVGAAERLAQRDAVGMSNDAAAQAIVHLLIARAVVVADIAVAKPALIVQRRIAVSAAAFIGITLLHGVAEVVIAKQSAAYTRRLGHFAVAVGAVVVGGVGVVR
ncbi:hypothetical protein D3C76_1050150 [compost metagenome]